MMRDGVRIGALGGAFACFRSLGVLAHGEVDEDLYFSGCAHGERV